MVFNVFKTIGSGLSSEVKDFKSVLTRMRHRADTPLGANFRKFGVSFNAYDFDDFLLKAREFYLKSHEADDPLFTAVSLPDNRVAIDYNGEIRGIFTKKGKPLAFFRPDYRQLGYGSKAAELDDFRQKGKVPL